MEADLIDKAVAVIWKPSMGINTLYQKVQEHLKSEDVELTKQQVKAAKLVLPYAFEKKDGCSLSEDKIKFITQKIQERQNHKRSRQFQDADYIQRGLVKMGVVFNDIEKTWSYSAPQEERAVDEKIDTSIVKIVDGERCQMCGKSFKSRNLVFKHLRDPGSECGNSIFANGEILPVAPSIEKKVEKKKMISNNNIVRTRARTGRTAQHANSTSSLWIGDLPLKWTRVGGKYKRFRALLRQYLPNDIPQPWVKTVVRKAYRKRSTQPREEKDEYLGYAIVVFRCDAEADTIRKIIDGVEVNPTEVFRSVDMDEVQLAQMPSFNLKVRSVVNSDSSMTPEIKTAGVDPPLREQLRPLTIGELEKRINQIKKNMVLQNLNMETPPNDVNTNGKSFTKSQQHETALDKAVELFNDIGPRKEIKSEGRLVPEYITKPLLEILKSLKWQVPNERTHLSAERYLVLPTNVANDRFYGDLREKCKELMQWADDSYFYSGIAVVSY